MLKNFALTAALAAAPLAANAIPITSFNSDIVRNGIEINGNDLGSIPFENLTGIPVILSGSVSGSGESVDALSALRFGLSDDEDDEDVSQSLDPATFIDNPDGDGASGSGSLDPFLIAVDEVAYLVFRDGTEDDMGEGDVATSFQVTPAPIPLPAAAWMLLGAIGGIGALAARNRART